LLYELSPVFPGGFYFFIHFFLLFGRFGGGVLQWGSGMFPILGLTFLLYRIFFNSALAPLSTSNEYQQRGGWLRRVELIVQACDIKRKEIGLMLPTISG